MPDGARNDPATAFRFTVRFDNFPPGGFTDCTGLTMETEVHELREGGVNGHVWKFATRGKQSNLTLKRGIVSKDLWSWFEDINRGKMQFRNGSILVHDPSGKTDRIEFQILQAFPIKWAGPELSAMGNTVAVESVEFAHQGLMRIK
ncbi:MAG: phage tail protein [Acidobacteria bacterium]|nr:MAG: phage tail protein [Acidobacteriota bacterium]